MQIYDITTSSGPDIYYNQLFRNVLEDHMTFLRNSQETTILNIEPAMAYKYEGDLFGLLFNYNIVFEYHWIVMRMNNMTNPNQTKSTLTNLIIPNKAIIERLRSVYMTKDRVVH